MQKKIVGVIIGSALTAILLWTLFLSLSPSVIVYISGGVDISESAETQTPRTLIHARIRVYDDSVLIMDQYHAGAITDLGDNATLAKLFGDSNYNLTLYDLNATYISIGNQGTLTTTSTVLPGEWNRTAGTVEDESQSWHNITCTFYPDSSGPYTADCIGLNFESGIGMNDLYAYDTFNEVTGIDDSFTINVEFKITVSHT